MIERNFLTEVPMYVDSTYPSYEEQNETEPERTREVDGEEYMTVSEYVRRIDPVMYPVVEELVSASGFDRTYIKLGQMAAAEGRFMGVAPVKMFHPEYDSVNGWPTRILDAAWRKFKYDYRIQWVQRDPERPATPEPVGMPAPSINPRLYDQIRAYAERKGTQYTPAHDPRWRGAMAVMLEAREGESPQQALIRRTSAAAALYAIEMEYEQR